MKSRLIRMTEGKPGKLILQFALPLMLGSIFQQTYTIVDTAVVGQVVGVDGLAALGAADWFNWLSLGICTGLAQGFSILIAQFFGAKDEFRLKKAVAMSFLLTLAAAVILTAIFQIAAGPVLHLMGTDPSIMEGSMTYVRICFSGICVVLSYNVLAAILRAIGRQYHAFGGHGHSGGHQCGTGFVICGGIRLGNRRSGVSHGNRTVFLRSILSDPPVQDGGHAVKAGSLETG